MLIKEYRITLPLTVEEYRIGQIYTTCQLSKRETGGGEGVEIIKTEPFTDKPLLSDEYSSGIYTYKIYHLSEKVPNFVQHMVPNGKVEIHEESWDAFPYCRTILTNPHMKGGFFVLIESIYLSDTEEENALQLDENRLQVRDVVFIDIASDPVLYEDFKVEEDPTYFSSKKTGRGPLNYEWTNKASPLMTCYKLVTCCFDWYGLENRVEHLVHKAEKRIFLMFHRKLFCWIDEWYGLKDKDLQRIEETTRKQLDIRRAGKYVQGMKIQ